jgi:hypothetical protein
MFKGHSTTITLVGTPAEAKFYLNPRLSKTGRAAAHRLIRDALDFDPPTGCSRNFSLSLMFSRELAEKDKLAVDFIINPAMLRLLNNCADKVETRAQNRMFLVDGTPRPPAYIAAQIHHLWVEDAAKKTSRVFSIKQRPSSLRTYEPRSHKK